MYQIQFVLSFIARYFRFTFLFYDFTFLTNIVLFRQRQRTTHIQYRSCAFGNAKRTTHIHSSCFFSTARGARSILYGRGPLALPKEHDLSSGGTSIDLKLFLSHFVATHSHVKAFPSRYNEQHREVSLQMQYNFVIEFIDDVGDNDDVVLALTSTVLPASESKRTRVGSDDLWSTIITTLKTDGNSVDHINKSLAFLWRVLCGLKKRWREKWGRSS